ncbi:PLD phosphodiesterase domain-containing protein [Tumidithrix helvetica PCC 7403]|uniref:phospholipase D family protein n=1 Tax=Tumidithrix helvetica TaxID=3457545 RepID=UPI003C89D4EA
MSEVGKQLEDLCRDSKNEILLVAPFIKVSALTRLFGHLSSNISVKCVTRWHLEDILAGVSDIEIWSLFRERQGSSLWLRSNLHAKYYRTDDRCLVGSANLTNAALGWSTHPNLELLISSPAIPSFEQDLFSECVLVDRDLYEQTFKTIELLRDDCPEVPTTIELLNTQDSTWLPRLRNPEDLYIAYCGNGTKLSTVSREAALIDLRSLLIPKGLQKQVFEVCVGTLLLQKPLIRQIDSFLEYPQRFGAVTEFMRRYASRRESLPCNQAEDFDADRSWQTLMRWLRYFLSDRYALSVPNHSEVFYRLKKDES